jgi:uncharacterized protein (DUF924 family)
VLAFWFGPKPHTAAQVAQRSQIWFSDPSAPELTAHTDEIITERFGGLLEVAERGGLKEWESSPRRRLALIVVLDQFSRNIHRGTAAAFAQDHRALSLAVSGMQIGADGALEPLERLFFYLPLVHAESLDVQEEAVAAVRRLIDEAPDPQRSLFERAHEAATQHRDLIARFGRFPHRNRILGRVTSAAESEWLAGEGRSMRFGQ